jgi:hypothetical protein
MPKPWNAQPGRLVFPSLDGVEQPKPEPIEGVAVGHSTGAHMATDDDIRVRALERWHTKNPCLFAVVLEAAAAARLRSLRCEPLGLASYRLWKTPAGDSERFEALLAERLPLTVFVAFGVESSQSVLVATDQG